MKFSPDRAAEIVRHFDLRKLDAAFYADPFVDMHNRMKEALVLLGKLPRATVRPPLAKLSEPEIDRVRMALVRAGLLEGGARRAA